VVEPEPVRNLVSNNDNLFIDTNGEICMYNRARAFSARADL